MPEFDIVIIGATRQGLAAAHTARAQGANVAIIEHGVLGGEELAAGRIPTGALIKAAQIFSQCHASMEFGIRSDNIRVAWSSVKLRIADVQDDIRALWRSQLKDAGIELIKGEARFEDADTLQVTGKSGSRALRAAKYILATGEVTDNPQIAGLNETGYLTPAQFFALPEMPRSLTVLGNNAYAIELSFAMAKLGCKVNLVHSATTLLPDEDADISTFAEKLLLQEGVALHARANIQCARQEGEKRQIVFEVDGEVQQTEARHILPLLAYRTNQDTLNLEAADSSLIIEGTQQPTARIVFTDPGMAAIGLSEDQARGQWNDVQVFQRKFAQHERSIIDGETRGFVKLVTGDNGRILGAHIAGQNAGELLGPFLFAMQEGSNAGQWAAHTAANAILSDAVQQVLTQYATSVSGQ